MLELLSSRLPGSTLGAATVLHSLETLSARASSPAPPATRVEALRLLFLASDRFPSVLAQLSSRGFWPGAFQAERAGGEGFVWALSGLAVEVAGAGRGGEAQVLARAKDVLLAPAWHIEACLAGRPSEMHCVAWCVRVNWSGWGSRGLGRNSRRALVECLPLDTAAALRLAGFGFRLLGDGLDSEPLARACLVLADKLALASLAPDQVYKFLAAALQAVKVRGPRQRVTPRR
jgi:hypothetical protein